jgi:hypothetical protein
MTLNSNYPGAVQMAPRRRLEGPERGLDALVGLVILLAELAVGFMSIYALYQLGVASGSTDAANAGFAIAVFGSGIVVIVTTLVYLGRVIAGRRSWPAPLWGVILMSAALIVGYVVMAA